jgi:hypothetical protein
MEETVSFAVVNAINALREQYPLIDGDPLGAVVLFLTHFPFAAESYLEYRKSCC